MESLDSVSSFGRHGKIKGAGNGGRKFWNFWKSVTFCQEFWWEGRGSSEAYIIFVSQNADNCRRNGKDLKHLSKNLPDPAYVWSFKGKKGGRDTSSSFRPRWISHGESTGTKRAFSKRQNTKSSHNFPFNLWLFLAPANQTSAAASKPFAAFVRKIPKDRS